MELHFIRHATMILQIQGKRILIDPVLARMGDIDFVPYAENRRKNPLIPLKTPIEEILSVDALVVSHMHVDHFDLRSRNRLRRDIPLFCQPCDEEAIRKIGFIDVRPIEDFVEWENIKIHRVNAKHGEGEALSIMGRASGFIFEDTSGFKTYIIGDSIWCEDVERTINKFKPNAAVANAGSASLPVGRPITMDEDDIKKLVEIMPEESKILAVHMDAWNHCMMTRSDLEDFLQSKRLSGRVIIPEENQIIIL